MGNETQKNTDNTVSIIKGAIAQEVTGIRGKEAEVKLTINKFVIPIDEDVLKLIIWRAEQYTQKK